MNDIVIKFEGVSKQYDLGTIGTGTLSHDLKRWWIVTVQGKEDPYLRIGEITKDQKKGKHEVIWALKNIDLEIKQGEIIGIIGRNGAGKSTLLKILSRVTTPSKGVMKARGRIASLLEVGTGFHPELTGRENIYMNGSIMGMTKREITRKLDEIVHFAEIERFLDTPVKRYSSGMTVRLGFAIAAHLEPEILVVDEVLAVGDAAFQKKAIGKMQDVSSSSGRTVLFVSHNIGAVKELCNRGVLLNNGQIVYDGTIESTINCYLNNDVTSHFHEQPNKIFRKFGIRINAVVKTQGNQETNIAFFNEKFSIIFKCEKIHDNILPINFVIQIFNEFGQKVTSINSAEEGIKSESYEGLFELEIMTNNINLYPGKYYINVMFVSSLVSEIIENIDSFEVLQKQINNSGFNYTMNHGIARIFEEFTITKEIK